MHSQDHRRTNAVPTQHQRACMFGFRLKAKSEDALEEVRGWYGVGTAMVGGGAGEHSMRAGRPGGRRAGESSRCEDPAPTAGIAGRASRGMDAGHHSRPQGGHAHPLPANPCVLHRLIRLSMGTAWRGITPRRAATLQRPWVSIGGPTGWHGMRIKPSGRAIINGNDAGAR